MKQQLNSLELKRKERKAEQNHIFKVKSQYKKLLKKENGLPVKEDDQLQVIQVQKRIKPNPFQKAIHKRKEEPEVEEEQRKKPNGIRKNVNAKLLKKTRKGQPIMANLVDHLLEKIVTQSN